MVTRTVCASLLCVAGWLLSLCACVQLAELRNSPVPFAHLCFSNDGKVLVAVHEGRIFVLDAFSGAWACMSLHVLSGCATVHSMWACCQAVLAR